MADSSVALSIAGAAIGLDIDALYVADVCAAYSFANVTSAGDAPPMWYRQEQFEGNLRFVRDDPLRSSLPVPIGRAVGQLIDDIQLSIALHARNEIFVHAGVVGWNGSAIVLPGRSHAGKSTLVEALVREGATYCSDEYACVTDDGAITPFPRPLHLRHGPGRRVVRPTTLGTVADEPLPPMLVLFTQYAPQAQFAPVAVDPSRAALELFDNTIIAEVDPARATSMAAKLASAAPAFRTDRPDAHTVVGEILRLAERTGLAA